MKTVQDIKDNLKTLSETLGSDLGTVLETGCAITEPCGESPQWDLMLAQYKISPLSKEDKTIEISRSKSTHGAAIDEVYRVCKKIIDTAKTNLPQTIRDLDSFRSRQENQIQQAMDAAESANDDTAVAKAAAELELLECLLDEIDSSYTRLDNLIDPLLENTIKKYKATVIPRKSMFGSIKKRAQDKKETAANKQKSGFVLQCKNCGAPRLSEADFECSFCGTSFGR